MSDGALVLENREKGWLDRFLSLFTEVHSGEGAGALLLALNVFLLLGSYYVLKTVREPLIVLQGGAEVKSYSSAGQALLFLIIVPIYGAIASRVNRVKLVGGVTAFFFMNLVVFVLLGTAGAKIGVAYFLWVGIFNMLAVAQFWGFANDLYTEEQGKRLFPIVGVGMSLGAWIGAVVAGEVYRTLGSYKLMLVSAVVLGICILLTLVSHKREAGRTTGERKQASEKPLDRAGGFSLVLKDKYLLLIAILVLLLSCVNTVGETVLTMFVEQSANALPEASRDAFVGEFYGDYYSWVNLLGFLMNTFLVARLFKWIGVRGGLFVLPLIALGGYGMLATIPVVAVVRTAKILENATDYSLNNMVRHALFLPTSREAKYKGKAATDTFFVRFGDMMQAVIVYVGTALSFTMSNFATVNVVLVLVWIVVAVMIYQRHKRIAAEA
jgi:AAA family ATP:ADP antiporter